MEKFTLAGAVSEITLCLLISIPDSVMHWAVMGTPSKQIPKIQKKLESPYEPMGS